MATYAIGDVHGQYDALMCLLDKINYQSDKDMLWFVGDLVNRGPKSLEVLRFVCQLKSRAIVVLGNHDFSLLVQAQNFSGVEIKKATKSILDAPDGAQLVAQMRNWPVAHIDKTRKIIMTHAGLYPNWSIKMASEMNEMVMQQLQGKNHRAFLRDVYGDKPACWKKTHTGMARWRFAVNAFCRMRYLDKNGCLDFAQKVAPAEAPSKLTPWFRAPQKCDWRQLFGHWASLGLHEERKVTCLDSGAAWQGNLTAYDVDKWAVAGQVAVP